MSVSNARSKEITDFILQNLRAYPADIIKLTTAHFNLSRQAVFARLKVLEQKKIIVSTGHTRNHQYRFLPISSNYWPFLITDYPAEDKVWRQDISPHIKQFPQNIIDICEYGFTEMFNNAVEHSEGRNLLITLDIYPDMITIKITDDGVGIFNKIVRCLNLDDPLHALLELSKGKLTTDPEHHTGEGIFFTSRMFDEFSIKSGNLFFIHRNEPYDWMFESDQPPVPGTMIDMSIDLISSRTPLQTFNQFTSNGSFGFDKTILPVFLARYGNENLVSRSQARRLLARVDRFKIVVLDFTKIDYIGQAFADEIFRVFIKEHPQTQILFINASQNVNNMIQHAQSGQSPLL